MGRSHGCDLRLDEQEASGQHARLRWQDGEWFVQDLGSRNGTYIDGARLHPPERATVRAGMRLAFGHVGNAWFVEDTTPPPIEAVPVDGGAAQGAVNGVLFLGAERSVQVRRAGEQWLFTGPGGRRFVQDQEQIEVAGRRWLLHLPTP